MNTQRIANETIIFYTTLIERNIPAYEAMLLTQSFIMHLMDIEIGSNIPNLFSGVDNENLSTE